MSIAAQQVENSATLPRAELRLVAPSRFREHRHFLTRGTPAYRRASLALFLSGFSTFSLLYCVQPLMPIFARGFRRQPGGKLPVAVAVDRLPRLCHLLRGRRLRRLRPAQPDVRLAAGCSPLHHRLFARAELASVCWSSAPWKGFCSAACRRSR